MYRCDMTKLVHVDTICANFISQLLNIPIDFVNDVVCTLPLYREFFCHLWAWWGIISRKPILSVRYILLELDYQDYSELDYQAENFYFFCCEFREPLLLLLWIHVKLNEKLKTYLFKFYISNILSVTGSHAYILVLHWTRGKRIIGKYMYFPK